MFLKMSVARLPQTTNSLVSKSTMSSLKTIVGNTDMLFLIIRVYRTM